MQTVPTVAAVPKMKKKTAIVAIGVVPVCGIHRRRTSASARETFARNLRRT